MSLEGGDLRRNRLEELGLPGYGKNPLSPLGSTEMHQEHDDLMKGANSDLSLDEYEEATNPAEENHVDRFSRKFDIMTICAAVAITIGSLMAYHSVSQKLQEAEDRAQSLGKALEKNMWENADLEFKNSQLILDREITDMKIRTLETDLLSAHIHTERVRTAYRAKILEIQSPLTQNSDTANIHANNGGGRRDSQGTRINNEVRQK